MAKVSTAPLCKISGVGDFPLTYGKSALAYLRRRTRENPWFAVASGVMHAGQIDYNRQQPYVEKVVAAGPVAALDFRTVAKLAKGAQDYSRIVAALPLASGCYQRHCGPDGRACVSRDGHMTQAAHEVMECLRVGELPLSSADVATLDSIIAQKATKERPAKSIFAVLKNTKRIKHRDGQWVKIGTNIGPKVRNMMAEYFGCSTGVAVDRHVGNWLANNSGRLAWIQKVKITKTDAIGRKRSVVVEAPVRYVKSQKEMTALRAQGIPAVSGSALSSPPTFALFKKTMLDLAAECGQEPAAVQVAAWAQGVCEDLRKKPVTHIELGAGYQPVACTDIPKLQAALSSVAVPVVKRPKGAPERFRCGTDYLGQAQQAGLPPGLPPGAVRIVRGPLKPPPGEHWTYEYFGKLRPMRILTKQELLGLTMPTAPRAARTSRAARIFV